MQEPTSNNVTPSIGELPPGNGLSEEKIAELLTAHERIVGARRGSDVKRYHTFPIVGEQTNGHHAYNMAVMLLMLHPEPSFSLIRAVLLHDGVEDVVGDLPSPSMWGNAALKREYDAAQHAAFEARYGFELGYELYEYDLCWLHCLDKLEALIFGYAQRGFGNFNAERIIHNVKEWFGKQIEEDLVPIPIVEYYALILRDDEVNEF